MNVKKPIVCLLSIAIAVSLSPTLSVSASVSDVAGTTPHTIFVTFNGDPKTSRGFTWYTNSNGLSSQVEYGTNSDLSDSTIISGSTSYEVDGGDRNISDGVTSNGITMTANADAVKVYCHKAVITGLKPGTKYYYRVGDAAKNAWSSTGSFTTESADNAQFNFIDVTDTQAVFDNNDYYSNWAPLIRKAFQTAPNASFILNCGDITNNGGDINQWYEFSDAAKSQLMSTTFVPVSGNHETYLAKTSGNYLTVTNDHYTDHTGSHSNDICGPYLDSFINHFNLALPSSEKTSDEHQGAYYDFNYGNALFLVLNTNLLNSDGTLTSDQLNWLETECRNSTQKWKIVALHRAIQSIGSHIADVDVQALRAQLLPVMAHDGIDIVLQGHDHTYMRSKQIGTSGTPVENVSEITETYNGVSTTFGVNPSGTVYIINGASNDKFYLDNYNAAGYETASKNIYPEYTSPAKAGDTLDEINDPTGKTAAFLPTYSIVNVNCDKLVVTTYQYDVKSGIQKIIDSYGLAKPDVSSLISRINALPSVDSLKASDADAVNEVYSAYSALDAVDQSAVSNSAKLLGLVEKLKTLTSRENSISSSNAASGRISNPKTGDDSMSGKNQALPCICSVLLDIGKFISDNFPCNFLLMII